MTGLSKFIRRFSDYEEFCFIIFLLLGPPVGSELWMRYRSEHVQFSNFHLIRLTVAEVVILAIILAIGKIRGWSLATFGAKISWKETVAGVLLGIGGLIVLYVGYRVAYAIYPEAIKFSVLPLAMPVILFNSLINPIFEEFLEAGYVIMFLQRFGMWPAVMAGAAIRFILHIYQGVDGALAVSAFGVLFGLVYWRRRQLLPLVIGHAMCDFILLLANSSHAGH